MLNQQTIEKLYAMRMRGMADAFTQQQEEPADHATQLRGTLRAAGGPPVELAAEPGVWNGGSERAACKVQPAWKTSTSVRREVWTSRWSGR